MSDVKAEVEECAHCHGPILGEPVLDAEQLAWLGHSQEWCSEECQQAASEAYWTDRWKP